MQRRGPALPPQARFRRLRTRRARAPRAGPAANGAGASPCRAHRARTREWRRAQANSVPAASPSGLRAWGPHGASRPGIVARASVRVSHSADADLRRRRRLSGPAGDLQGRQALRAPRARRGQRLDADAGRAAGPDGDRGPGGSTPRTTGSSSARGPRTWSSRRTSRSRRAAWPRRRRCSIPTGKRFTEDDIGGALALRDLLASLREAGTHTGGPAALPGARPLAVPPGARRRDPEGLPASGNRGTARGFRPGSATHAEEHEAERRAGAAQPPGREVVRLERQGVDRELDARDRRSRGSPGVSGPSAPWISSLSGLMRRAVPVRRSGAARRRCRLRRS